MWSTAPQEGGVARTQACIAPVHELAITPVLSKCSLTGAALLLLISGCSSPPAPRTPGEERPISRGDRLEVVLSSVQNAMTNEVCRTVDGDGNIDLPFLHNLRVLGLTPTEASTLIVNRYVPRERDLSVKVTRAP